jgi:hypothetical protein
LIRAVREPAGLPAVPSHVFSSVHSEPMAPAAVLQTARVEVHPCALLAKLLPPDEGNVAAPASPAPRANAAIPTNRPAMRVLPFTVNLRVLCENFLA